MYYNIHHSLSTNHRVVAWSLSLNNYNWPVKSCGTIQKSSLFQDKCSNGQMLFLGEVGMKTRRMSQYWLWRYFLSCSSLCAPLARTRHMCLPRAIHILQFFLKALKHLMITPAWKMTKMSIFAQTTDFQETLQCSWPVESTSRAGGRLRKQVDRVVIVVKNTDFSAWNTKKNE